jgi:hypothetical protein
LPPLHLCDALIEPRLEVLHERRATVEILLGFLSSLKVSTAY